MSFSLPTAQQGHSDKQRSLDRISLQENPEVMKEREGNKPSDAQGKERQMILLIYI